MQEKLHIVLLYIMIILQVDSFDFQLEFQF